MDTNHESYTRVITWGSFHQHAWGDDVPAVRLGTLDEALHDISHAPHNRVQCLTCGDVIEALDWNDRTCTCEAVRVCGPKVFAEGDYVEVPVKRP